MSNSLQDQIQTRIDSFVEDIASLVREAALQSVHEALGGTSAPRATRAGSKAKPRTASGKKPAQAKAKPKKGKRVRRSSEDVDKLAAAVLAHVKANPGQGIAEIRTALGRTTKDLRLPVLKLTKEGRLKTKGQKRATTYYAGSARKAAPRALKAPAQKRGKRVSKRAKAA